MLKADFEFYKGILFVRLKGILTHYSLINNNINLIVDGIGFKYVVFNINDIRQIDVDGIKYLINYCNSLEKRNSKALVCVAGQPFFEKFKKWVPVINKEKEVFNKI